MNTIEFVCICSFVFVLGFGLYLDWIGLRQHLRAIDFGCVQMNAIVCKFADKQKKTPAQAVCAGALMRFQKSCPISPQ